jgi:hypothetical protein
MDIDCTICDFVRSCQAALKLDKLQCIEVATRFYAKQPQNVLLQKQLTPTTAAEQSPPAALPQVTAVQQVTSLATKLAQQQEKLTQQS